MARQSKGPRVRTSIAFPAEVMDAARERAYALGYDGVNDYLQALVVDEARLPEQLAPEVRLPVHQGVFSMTG